MNNNIYTKKYFIAASAVLMLFIIVALIFAFAARNNKTPFIQTITPGLQAPFSPSATYPASRIDLTNWKLTLPISSPEDSDVLIDIKNPELETYQINPWFTLNTDKTGVVFRAPVNAPTTPNSNYPRTELREMTDDGKEEAFWPSKKGTHTLILDQAITAVPKNKPVVVAGQIHGDDDDLIVIRLEYPKLYVSRGSSNLYTLDENYTLGKRFVIKFVASGGEIKVYYNGSNNPVHTLKKEVDEAYFKAGVYTQSNCETEDSAQLCNADNYGEVVIYQITLIHQK